MQLGELYTELTVKDSKFKRGMRGAREQLAMTARSMDAFRRKAQLVFFGAAAAMGYFVKRASDVEEQGTKFVAVFKEQTAAAEEFAKTLAKTTNRNVYEIKNFMASLQDTFVPLGYARDSARELSSQLVKLGIDVASFQNKAESDVLRDFQSAIVGNHETVRRYGIIITEARLKQEAINNKIWDGTGELSAMAKVQARLNLIMQGTTDAQGDALRTAGSFANQMKALRASMDEVVVELGQALLPLAKGLVATFKEIVPRLAQWIRANASLIAGIGRAILAFGVFLGTLKIITAALAAFVTLLEVAKRGVAGLATAAAAITVAGVAAYAAYSAFDHLEGKFKTLTAAKEKLNQAMRVNPGAGGVAAHGETPAGMRAKLGLGPGESINPATGRVTRGGFSRAGGGPGGGNTQFEPTFRSGEIKRGQGGFTGIADLAKTIQQNVFQREEERRAKKMLLINGRQLKTLEDIKTAIKDKGVGLAIT